MKLYCKTQDGQKLLGNFSKFEDVYQEFLDRMQSRFVFYSHIKELDKEQLMEIMDKYGFFIEEDDSDK